MPDKRIYLEPWYVYIVECSDKTFYVGIARNVERRLHEHNHTKSCRYTRTRQPVVLKYTERYPNHEFAIKREIQIKTYTREKKLSLCSKE